MGGIRRDVLVGQRDWLRGRIKQKPDLTLQALRAELAERGARVSLWAIWRYCVSEGLSFKKSLLPTEQDRTCTATIWMRSVLPHSGMLPNPRPLPHAKCSRRCSAACAGISLVTQAAGVKRTNSSPGASALTNIAPIWYGAVLLARPVKRRRALLGSNPPRNSRWKLIAMY
jgi:hypothetical protein